MKAERWKSIQSNSEKLAGQGRRAAPGRGLEAAGTREKQTGPQGREALLHPTIKVLLVTFWELEGRPLVAVVAPEAWSKDPSDSSVTPGDPWSSRNAPSLPHGHPALFRVPLSRLNSTFNSGRLSLLCSTTRQPCAHTTCPSL